MSLIASMFISWNSTYEELFPFFHIYLFIYLFIRLFFMLVWTHVYLLYSMDYIHNYIYSVTQIAPLWSLRMLWHWLLCTFTTFPSFCGHFLTYWHKMLQVYVIFAVKNWMSDIVLLRIRKPIFVLSLLDHCRLWYLTHLSANSCFPSYSRMLHLAENAE